MVIDLDRGVLDSNGADGTEAGEQLSHLVFLVSARNSINEEVGFLLLVDAVLSGQMLEGLHTDGLGTLSAGERFSVEVLNSCFYFVRVGEVNKSHFFALSLVVSQQEAAEQGTELSK